MLARATKNKHRTMRNILITTIKKILALEQKRQQNTKMEIKNIIMEIIDSKRSEMQDADYLRCSNWLMHAEDQRTFWKKSGVVHVFVDHAQQALHDRQQDQERNYSMLSHQLYASFLSCLLVVWAHEYSKDLAVFLIVLLGISCAIVEHLKFRGFFN